MLIFKPEFQNPTTGPAFIISSWSRRLWHGKWKDIEVILSNDEEPAIGTGLLQGSVVKMDFVKNRLTIEEPIRAKRRKRQTTFT